ncbi:MAG: class I adenylate cyclase, partial [Oceanobacter sp.]
MNTEIPAPNQNLLRQWQEGFWQLSQSRLHRARLLMPARQAEVLDLLPLLLHLNHPQLPGFVDYSTPAAIEFFAPTSNLMERAKTLFRSLPKASQIRHQEAAISALYLMGSLGSLAQSRQSDLDLWLCLRRPLGAEDLQKLESKCRYIERWAEQQGAELHIFIMDLEQFGQRENETLDSENCGSTQHKLLLDEFYRASILLAGKMPRWWLIPVACKTEQQAELWWHQLIEQRLVNPDHWLNPGHVSQIPEQEFLGAGLWQLSKGLKSPYKSLLKLLLYRQYAEQFPQGQPLCQDLKSLIHGGVRDSDQCDAYVLLVEKILSGLQTSEHQGRANLVRRAFYLKTGIKLSYPRRQLDDWRRQPLEQLVQQWGWSASALIDLDNQETWSVNLVVRERNALVAEMIGSYRTLVRFNQKQQTPLSIRREDIQKLGYQLTAAYDSRPGKVQNINPGIVRSLAQEAVTIIQFPGVWQLATGRCPKLPPDEKILKQAPSLIELLAFCWQNGLIQRETRLYTLSGKTPIERYELLQLSASIGRILKSAGKVASESDAWARKPCPASVHMFVNVAHDPMAALTQSGKQRVSNQTDPFCFGTQKENLVQSLDVLLSNSWGEWEVFKFPHSYPVSKQTSAPVSTQALMRWLQMLVPMLNDPHQRPDLEIHCYSQTRAAQIRTRLNELLHHLL